MKRALTTVKHLAYVTDGPLAWWAWIDIDEQSLEGIRTAEVHFEHEPIVAVAVTGRPGEEDELVGLCWDDDHTNALINPEDEFNNNRTNSWFVGIWPRGDQPTPDELRSTDQHLRTMEWNRIQREAS